MTSVLWLRRDLRIADHPALHAAADDGPVLPLFVRDPQLAGAGDARRSRLEASLAAFDEATDGALVVRSGDPAEVVAQVVKEAGAEGVHVTGEFTPYARRRDRRVADRLREGGIPMAASGTPYVVRPGTILSRSETPYQVFTPYSRAWRDRGAEPPLGRPRGLRWRRTVESEGLDDDLLECGRSFGPVGEDAARERWQEFAADGLERYSELRDRPDLDGTSRLSVHLRHGEIHPRTLLADLGGASACSEGARTFVDELAWREFYADVLWHRPDSAWGDLREDLAKIRYDSGPEVDELVDAWRRGRTGFPFVDAGMRQLLETGWMHNRVRMVVASFLVKDLHVWWPVGARHFLDHLVDGDLASNNHGWQWAAGTGTDAAPYFRVFNPVTQGKRFDPGGDYVRRWVPELAHLSGCAAHEPWRHQEGYDDGYPERIVDHDEERKDALDRYQQARARRPSPAGRRRRPPG
jgi:deoxyribodipyrimidine photo-lyase